MTFVLLKGSRGGLQLSLLLQGIISKKHPPALLAAYLISGQQDHCLSSKRLSYLERVWDSSESHLTPGL